MNKITLNIEGLSCASCSASLEKYLNKQKGIIKASVNLVMATALIEYDDTLQIKEIEKFVEQAGFVSKGQYIKEEKDQTGYKLLILSVLAIILMYTAMSHMLKWPLPNFFNMEKYPERFVTLELLLTIPFLIFGFDIVKNGIKNLIRKAPNMDSLLSIGIIISFVYSLYFVIMTFTVSHEYMENLYFESSAFIIFFVKLGRFIDKRNKEKAKDAIKNLVKVTPEYGYILINGKVKKISIDEINKGDILFIKPGERFAVDGVITDGSTHVDESFITGESVSFKKSIGDKVLAGSINYDGAIYYKAEEIGKDSTISKITRLVIEAVNTKAPIEKLADKVSGYFVPTIFVLAFLSFILNLITVNINAAITSLVNVLVIACPCALGLATPLAMVTSIGTCSKNGILIKNSEALEQISKIKNIVFDKTGTITIGNLNLSDYKYDNNNILDIICSLEENSNHPIASAFSKVKYNKVMVKDFKNYPGYGISGEVNGIKYYAGNKRFISNLKLINSFNNLEDEYAKKGAVIVYLFDDKNVLGIFGLRDEIKEEVPSLLKRIKKDKQIYLLTGDNKKTAGYIAKELEIENVFSECLPENKVEQVKKIKNVMMIGDGINDAPALKAANIGVSVYGGTDISADSSDIVLMKNNLHLIEKLFIIGNKTNKIIKENLFWALFYNILMIPIAMGLFPIKINPMLAALAMTFSSLTVVLNSLRLLKVGKNEKSNIRYFMRFIDNWL